MAQPNLKDVARAAGVHAATASRALNERTASMVSAATVRRVREAAESLGYRPNHLARGLKTRRTLTVGMLVPDITNPFFPPMVRGVEDSLGPAGYTLVLADTDNDETKDRLAQEVMLERQGRRHDPGHRATARPTRRGASPWRACRSSWSTAPSTAAALPPSSPTITPA